VALSSDSSTALIGGPDGEVLDVGLHASGLAWSFVRSGSTWTQQGEPLASGEHDNDFENFGISLALSSDGNTALVGNQGGERARPAGAWIFTRSGSMWTRQSEKLARGAEGRGVTLSADASTALVGTAVYVNSPPHK
jgi:hypothetical protein